MSRSGILNQKKVLSAATTTKSLVRHLSGTACRAQPRKMPLHHLMIGTWTPPGAIFTVQFDDEKLELKLIKRTEIPEAEPISWMTFDVSATFVSPRGRQTRS